MRSNLDFYCPSWYESNKPDWNDADNNNTETVMFDYQTSSSGTGKLNAFRPMRKWEKSYQPTENKVTLDGYSLSYLSTVKQNQWQTHNGDNSKCNAMIKIKLSPKPFVTVQHQQAITYENMLGR